MKLGVTGSRSIVDQDYIEGCLHDAIRKLQLLRRHDGDHGYQRPAPIVLLTGGAKGVDEVAAEYAKAWHYDHVLFKPAFLVDGHKSYSPRDYLLRNKQIVDNSDYVVAIWDGSSRGTGYTINYARKVGRPLYLYQRHPDMNSDRELLGLYRLDNLR